MVLHQLNEPEQCGARRKIGYARVSTNDQKMDMQLDALTAAGCEKVFYDHGVSGGTSVRSGLDQLLEYIVEGDMVVVYKLDRLGRSSFHLADLLSRFGDMDVQFCSLTEGISTANFGGRFVYHLFAAVAEFHRDLIRENTINGLRAARARGSKIGRPRKLSNADVIEAHRRVRHEGQKLSDIAQCFSVSESTLARRLREVASVNGRGTGVGAVEHQ